MSFALLKSSPILCHFPPRPSSLRTPRSSCFLLPPPPPPLAAAPLRRFFVSKRRGNLLLLTPRGTSTRESPVEEEEEQVDVERRKGGGGGDGVEGGGGGGGGGGGSISDWTTSVLLFGVYAAIGYYVLQLAPNQTPSRDMYFVQKLLNMKGNDGFRMNEVLVALWYIMGLWPILYSMLLLPTGKSSKGNAPVWPFISLSFFFGAFALIPYFILWKPPPPPVEEEEIGAWPLNFLESKITAAIAFAAGLGLITYAGLANGDTWKEFYQYFRESRLVHVTSLDFSLLSAFSAFWVYNDMTARRWYDKGSWILPFTLIPFIGPALYLLLRPSLSALPTTQSRAEKD